MSLWIVGRWYGEAAIEGEKPMVAWTIEAVFDTEEAAVALALDREPTGGDWQYFIGPIELNAPLAPERSKWPGAYYPAHRTYEDRLHDVTRTSGAVAGGRPDA